MSEVERVERAPEKAPRERTGNLFERLRSLLGLGAGSVRDDIEDALEGADGNADFTPQERTILKNVLGLHDVRVADVMVPRADIIAVPVDTSLSELLALFRTAGHSRLPSLRRNSRRPPGNGSQSETSSIFFASEPQVRLGAAESRRRRRSERASGVEVGMNMPLVPQRRF